MATQMNDDGTVSDAVTKETQKGYANYEADLKKAQEKMLSSEQKTKDKYMNLLDRGMEMLGRKKREPEENSALINIGRGMTQGAEDYANKPKGMKKGGKVKSASARADGCAIRGKTRA
jgi:uncharacterized protein with von Willebrand factor type A (vWA) domain